ncbi:MAG: hypothetical protein PHE73_01155 [Sulfurovaceae bacterium]|nr:hypothetical protein [Sulfurovaceae bacterium]
MKVKILITLVIAIISIPFLHRLTSSENYPKSNATEINITEYPEAAAESDIGSATDSEYDCNDLVTKYTNCFLKAYSNQQCLPGTDIILPPECNNPENLKAELQKQS